MPPALSEFPLDMQEAFFIYEKLKNTYDSMNGIYLGKDLSYLSTVFDIYEIEDRRLILDLILLIDSVYTEHSIKKAKQDQKRKDRSTAGPTPNIKYGKK